MSHRILIVAALLAVGIIGGSLILRQYQRTIPAQLAPVGATPAQTQITTGSASSTSPGSGYTLAQVAAHNSASSCWTAINGKVYDVTSWINEHPGGPEHILGICGEDGSAAFNDQHAGQSQPAQELAMFYIGDLAQ